MNWPQTTQLKIALYNAENLFLLFDETPSKEWLKFDEVQWQKLSTSVYENKPLAKCHAIAKIIKDLNPDILMLCEVGGPESLKNFNDLFLDSQYSSYLVEGNSDRHIDIGYLVKKNLNFYCDLQSNKNRQINFMYPHEKESVQKGFPIKMTSNRFSRDVAELHCFVKDRDNPFMIILLAHLKSRLDPDKVDPGGTERRAAELKALIEIYKEHVNRHPQIPIFVAGDLNGQAHRQATDEEFKELYTTTDLEDVLEIDQVKYEDRATFYQIRNGGKTEGKQIDYCFVSQQFKSLIKPGSAQVYRYKDEFGFALPIPTNLDGKFSLPSDHYLLSFEIENLKMK